MKSTSTFLYSHTIYLSNPATPAHINISKIRENVSALPGTQTIEEFHVWALTNDKLAVSAKIKINHEAFGGKRHYLRRVRKEILNELDSGTSILSFIIELN